MRHDIADQVIPVHVRHHLTVEVAGLHEVIVGKPEGVSSFLTRRR
jgi:hypothetical protein